MRSLPDADPLTPAPGRTVVPLGHGWVAVLLEPLPSTGVMAIGLFNRGELAVLLDGPAAIRRLVPRLLALRSPAHLRREVAPHPGEEHADEALDPLPGPLDAGAQILADTDDLLERRRSRLGGGSHLGRLDRRL